MQRSIVITGLGLVTSIGIGREAFWHNLLMGRSGIGPVQAFDTSAYRGGTQGAEVKAFRAADYLVRLDPAGMGRASQFATATARLAIADAQLDVSALDPDRRGVHGHHVGEPTRSSASTTMSSRPPSIASGRSSSPRIRAMSFLPVSPVRWVCRR